MKFVIPARAVMSALVLGIFVGTAHAQPNPKVSTAIEAGEGSPAPPSLQGLTSAEAGKLIRILQESQRKLKAGDDVYFELLSGAPASFSATNTSPRQAFLSIDFDKAFIIKRLQGKGKMWQPYRFTFRSRTRERTVWQVDAVFNLYDNIEQVQVINKVPPPF